MARRYDPNMLRDFWRHLRAAYQLARKVGEDKVLGGEGERFLELVQPVSRLGLKYELPAWALLNGRHRLPGPLDDALERMEALDPVVKEALTVIRRGYVLGAETPDLLQPPNIEPDDPDLLQPPADIEGPPDDG